MIGFHKCYYQKIHEIKAHAFVEHQHLCIVVTTAVIKLST